MNVLEWTGWKLTGARNRVVDLVWERRLGIRTAGRVQIAKPDANRYETFAYSSIAAILRRLELGASDVVVDVGCGKGRVVCCAATLDVARVVGVDIDPALCETARENAARLRGRRASVELRAIPAQGFDFSDVTAIVMFNPFGEATMKQVTASLCASLERRPREVRVAYVNPLHEGVLARAPGFERYDHWPRAPWTGLKQNVSFWRARATRPG